MLALSWSCPGLAVFEHGLTVSLGFAPSFELAIIWLMRCWPACVDGLPMAEGEIMLAVGVFPTVLLPIDGVFAFGMNPWPAAVLAPEAEKLSPPHVGLRQRV
jgi:hypothetical protein